MSEAKQNDRSELENLKKKLDVLMKNNGSDPSYRFPHKSLAEVLEFDQKFKKNEFSMKALVFNCFLCNRKRFHFYTFFI